MLEIKYNNIDKEYKQLAEMIEALVETLNLVHRHISINISIRLFYFIFFACLVAEIQTDTSRPSESTQATHVATRQEQI